MEINGFLLKFRFYVCTIYFFNIREVGEILPFIIYFGFGLLFIFSLRLSTVTYFKVVSVS